MRSRAVSRTSLALALVALALAIAAGCGPKLAATVNGVKIPESQVDTEIAAMRKEHPDYFKGAAGAKLEVQFRKRIVDNLVTNVLVLQEAKAKGISVTDAEIQSQIDSMAHAYPSRAAFEAALAKSGTTLEALKERLRTQTLSQKMVSRVTGEVKVTDAEARLYYQANKELFGGQPTLHVSAIKLRLSDFAKAKKLAAQLKSGASFAKVAKAESIDQASKAKGGDLGTKALSEFPVEVATAARSAVVGAIVGPYQTGGATWIIKVLDRKPAAQKPFSAVKSQILSIVKQEKQVKAFNDWIQSLKKKANIRQ